jgi:16S rRNA (adenine1518-N6/adenine1519-N6)-dimethyltransferase
MLDAIVESAGLEPADAVLEIGCGPGNLTAEVASVAKLVVAVEVEPLLYRLATENLEYLNVRLILADAMESKFQLNPIVEREIWRALADTGSKQFKVVSNLPYGISVPVMMALLGRSWSAPAATAAPAETDGPQGPYFPVSMMILAVQKEVADRLAAPPDVKDYGPVSVAAQGVARIRRLRKMPPNVFWPRPQVESALIEVVPDEALRARIADVRLFHRLIAALFEQRRKTLMNSLRNSKTFGDIWPKLLAAMGACGIDPSLRGEALSVEEIIGLANTLARS